MAYQVRRINPIDNQPNKAVGLDIPFNAKGVFNNTFDTRQAIKVNLYNLFLTAKGERFLNPNFGSSIRNLLFDQYTRDKEIELRSEIEALLRDYFPEIRVENIILDSNESTLNFRLSYSIPNFGIRDNLDATINA